MQRASRDHACKHLLGLVMDYLNPEFEEIMARFKDLATSPEAFDGFPGPVADALNILRHEKIGRWESQNWVWAEPPTYDCTAKHVAEGEYDRQKQDALYGLRQGQALPVAPEAASRSRRAGLVGLRPRRRNRQAALRKPCSEK